MTDDARPRVFLSFAVDDASVATFIERSINTEFPVQKDHDWSGDSIFSLILEEITASDFIVMLLSRSALQSGWSAKEGEFLAAEARRRGVDFIPVLLEPCELPAALRETEAVDLSSDGAIGVARLMQRLRGQGVIDFRKLTSEQFEQLVIQLLRMEDPRASIEASSKDFGRDAIIRKEEGTWILEVIHTLNDRVTLKRLDQIVRYVDRQDRVAHALIVTSGQLTSIALSRLHQANLPGAAKLDIIDGVTLKQRLVKYPNLVAYYFGARN